MFSTYQEWQESVEHELVTENPLVDCSECDGDGEIIKECHCCGHETEKECEECEGSGQVHYLDSADRADLSRRKYVKHVTDDIKRLCVFTGRDALQMLGEFAKEYRGGAHG